jgi:2,4-dienoyl-CoA reductase-like NADH-dependent reductase (Old Yellow Enzyme family)
MSQLFTPLTLRGTTVKNRVWVSPMCQYSSEDGMPNDWHLVHLGARATGGAGLVFTEASAVTAQGRISPQDAGIWNDDQAARRLSVTDWAPGGWDVEQTVELASLLVGHGVDLIDVSSGGLVPEQKVAAGPGYQVSFARVGSGLPAAAVGLITEPGQAEQILAEGSADAVLLARALLRDPCGPLRAAHELGADVVWPSQNPRAAWS